MDTVLNLGLNDETVKALAKASGSERFAYDSYRRFLQMFSDVVLGADLDLYEEALENMKKSKGYKSDTDLTAEDLKELVKEYKEIGQKLGKVVPQDPWEQLWAGIGAVFGSWMVDRAITYRKLNNIPGDWVRPLTYRPWSSAMPATTALPAYASPATPLPARTFTMANI